MGKPKAPKAPDPIATGAAQTGTNIGTAVANSYLNNYNQVTPDGTLSFDQTGTQSWTDPQSGQTYEIPRFTATQELSQAGQQVKAASDQADVNMAGIARDQSAKLGSLLASPVNINNEATEARLMELGRSRLDPALDRRRQDIQTQLSQQGIKLGSAAYDRAMSGFGEQENDAYNQLLLTGRGQAVQETLAERNQPINEITALLSGSQVSQPNFVNPNTSPIATTDYAGLINQNFQNQMGIYGQKSASRDSLIGGLFGAGGTLGGAYIISDERTKTDVERIGKTDEGVPLYTYRYKDGIDSGRMHIGPMAQEVEKKQPNAVVKMGDLYGVNYQNLR